MIKVPAERIRGNPVSVARKINLNQFGQIVINMAEQTGLKLSVNVDTAKIGGGIFIKPVECLVIKNLQKSGYYSIVITQEYQGNVPFISYYFGGNSSNYTREVTSNGGSGLLNALVRPNKHKQQEEYMYYDLINQIVNNALEAMF